MFKTTSTMPLFFFPRVETCSRSDTTYLPIWHVLRAGVSLLFLKRFPADRVRLRDFCLFGTHDRTWRHWSYVECWLWMPDATWHPGVLPPRCDSLALPRRCHFIFCATEIWIGCKRIDVGGRFPCYAIFMSKFSAN